VLRGMDPRLIAALTDNPELLRALMQRATRRPAAGAAASGSGSDAGSDGEEGEEEEEGGVREVSCRVA
jgi:ribosomal protein L12E/L44/L45/RPP1/RPP2